MAEDVPVKSLGILKEHLCLYCFHVLWGFLYLIIYFNYCKISESYLKFEIVSFEIMSCNQNILAHHINNLDVSNLALSILKFLFFFQYTKTDVSNSLPIFHPIRTNMEI